MKRPNAAQVLIAWLQDSGFNAGSVVTTDAAESGTGFIQVLTLPGADLDHAKVRSSSLSVEAFAAKRSKPDWESARAMAEDVAWRLADPGVGQSIVHIADDYLDAYLTAVEVSEPGDLPLPDQELAHVQVDVLLHWGVVEA